MNRNEAIKAVRNDSTGETIAENHTEWGLYEVTSTGQKLTVLKCQEPGGPIEDCTLEETPVDGWETRQFRVANYNVACKILGWPNLLD